MTGCVTEPESPSSEPEPKKKMKTLMPVKSDESPHMKLSDKALSDSESESESEEETRVINDIDYEALEDIWLKAGEIDAKAGLPNTPRISFPQNPD